jgi:FkbM family methyltransferase
MINGLSEQSLIDWCANEFKNPDKLFIDIGAHVGMYALSLAPYFKQVHAFECQRETYYQLCGGVALNSVWNVYPHHVALGDNMKQDVPIYIVSEDGGGTSLHTNPKLRILETQTSNMKTLDSYTFKNIGFIKIDAEGAEEQVLRGAINTLKSNNYPPILFECWVEDEYKPKRDSLLNFIRNELGYDVKSINCYPYMLLATKA